MNDYEKAHIERLYQALKKAKSNLEIAAFFTPTYYWESVKRDKDAITEAISHHETYFQIEVKGE